MLPRAAAFGALALGLGLDDAFHESLWNASTWADTAVIALVLMPGGVRARAGRAAATRAAAELFRSRSRSPRSRSC